MLPLRVPSLLVLILVLAACGGPGSGGGNGGGAPADGGGDGGGGGGDPCRFVTVEEVEAALGVEVAEATAAAETTCTFTDAEEAPVFAYSVVETNESVDVRAIFDEQRETAEEVEGIGDGALWFGSGAMYVIKGDTLINMVATIEGEDAELRPAVEGLARIMAERM